MTMELNDSNSIKLRKGILVVRKYKEGVDELNEFQSIRGYSVVNRQAPKSVRYNEGNALEKVKYFSKDAEPNAPALTFDQVIQIQNELENLKAEEVKIEDNLSQEQQRKDGISKERKRALDNIKKKKQRKEEENIMLQNMKPEIEYVRGSLVKIQKPDDYFLSDPEEDSQIDIQKERESRILSKVYFHEENIPKNPSMDSMKVFNTKNKMIVKGSSLKNTYLKNKGSIKDQSKTDLSTENVEQSSSSGLNLLSASLNQDNEASGNYNHATGLQEYNTSTVDFSNTLNNETLHHGGEKLDSETLSEESLQQIKFLRDLSQNYRTIPCKNYHGSQGCGRSRYCHFIHLSEYEGKEIPKDVFGKVRPAYINKRDKVLKEINSSEKPLTDTRVGVLYQYMQKFLTLDTILEHEIQQRKETDLPKSYREGRRNGASVKKSYIEETEDQYDPLQGNGYSEPEPLNQNHTAQRGGYNFSKNNRRHNKKMMLSEEFMALGGEQPSQNEPKAYTSVNFYSHN